jgi:hypothetical protein
VDEALGLIDGYTPGVASLIGRCAAEHPFGQAEKSFAAYTGLKVQARQFQRLAEHMAPLVERFLRTNLLSGEKRPPRVYVAVDGTGAPLRHEELKGRKGRQPDGSAQTHEVKVGAVFTQHPVVGQKPWRDLDFNTYVATTERSEVFGQMMRAEFIRRFRDSQNCFRNLLTHISLFDYCALGKRAFPADPGEFASAPPDTPFLAQK